MFRQWHAARKWLLPRGGAALVLLLGAWLLNGAPCAAEGECAPRNSGFEQDLQNWRVEHPAGITPGSVSAAAWDGAAGKKCARLTAAATGALAGITCDPVAVPRGGGMRLRFQYRTLGRPELIEARVRPLDEKGQALVPWQNYQYAFLRILPAAQWTAYVRDFMLAPEASAYDITFWVRGGTLFVDEVQVRALRPEEGQVPATGARIRGVGGNDAAVWYESALKKVYRGTQPPGAQIEAIPLAAARGECVPFQVALQPKRDVDSVHVLWQDMLGPGVIRREQGRAAWVDSVNVSQARAPLGMTGAIPDPLSAEEHRDLKAGQTQPIWLTLTVPRDARPGLYQGRVRIESDGHDLFFTSGLPALEIPVSLRVRDFALPESPTLTTIARISKCPPDGRDACRADLRAHRITGEGSIGPLPVTVNADGSVQVDFAPFDAAAERYFNEQGMRLFNFPDVFLGDASGFYAKDRKWHGLTIFSPEFERAFSSYVRQVADHLRGKGWLRYALVQLWDEPQNEEMRDAVRRLAALARAAAPDARLYLTAAPSPALEGCADIWNVPLPDQFDAAAAAAAQARGQEIWGYENRLYSLDRDASSLDLRAFPWRLKRFGITGVEWWSISNWTGDPYAKPNQYEPQNGGGFFLYPNRSGSGAPADSIRWEMYREGVEDYDALAVLEKQYAEARRTLAVQDARFDSRDLIQRLTRPVAPSMDRNTGDPRVLEQAREAVDTLISLCGGAIPCLVRFEGEGKTLCLYGVTLPETTVQRGRKTIPVDAAGRFSLRPEGNRFCFTLRRGEAQVECDLALPQAASGE